MKKTIITSIISLCILALCQGQSNKNNAIPDTFQLYFPHGSFKKTFSNHEMKYSTILYAMEEPIIYADEFRHETYRFLYIRYLADPIVIRIEKQENDCILYWKVWNGFERYIRGNNLSIDKQKTINDDTWNEFKRLLNQANFWNMETMIDVDESLLFCESDEYILEGKISNQYHVVERLLSHRRSKYFQCCNFLIKLTNLKKLNINKY